jgi:hypothetical protein
VSGYVGIFIGHHYRHARALGEARWRQRKERAALFDACCAVLARLADDDLLPIEPRSVGYRLIGLTIAEKRLVKNKDEHPRSERAGLRELLVSELERVLDPVLVDATRRRWAQERERIGAYLAQFVERGD